MDFDGVYDETVTGVSAAAGRGDLRALRSLVESGKATDGKDNRGWMALHCAAAAGHVDCVNLLLDQESCDVNWRTFDGSTALSLACRSERVSEALLRALLLRDASVDLASDSGQTALHFLVESKARDIALYACLTEHGASVNVQGMWGRTPLNALFTPLVQDSPHEVLEEADVSSAATADKEALPIARLFLDLGADPSVVDDEERSPFQAALLHGYHTCALAMLERVRCPRLFLNARVAGVTGLCALAACPVATLTFWRGLAHFRADPWLTSQGGVLPIHEACVSASPEAPQLIAELLTDAEHLADSKQLLVSPLSGRHLDTPLLGLAFRWSGRDYMSRVAAVVDSDLPLPAQGLAGCATCPSCGRRTDLEDAPYECRMVDFDHADQHSPLSLLLTDHRGFGEDHYSLVERMINKGGSWCLTRLTPVTNFVLFQRKCDVQLIARTLRLLQSRGFAVDPDELWLIMAFAQEHMLEACLENGLIQAEDLVTDEVLDYLRRLKDVRTISSTSVANALLAASCILGSSCCGFVHGFLSLLGGDNVPVLPFILHHIESPSSLMTLAFVRTRAVLRANGNLNWESVSSLQVPETVRQTLMHPKLSPHFDEHTQL